MPSRWKKWLLRSAVESVCGRVVLEILADQGGNLMHNGNEGRDGLCVCVVLQARSRGSAGDPSDQPISKGGGV